MSPKTAVLCGTRLPLALAAKQVRCVWGACSPEQQSGSVAARHCHRQHARVMPRRASEPGGAHSKETSRTARLACEKQQDDSRNPFPPANDAPHADQATLQFSYYLGAEIAICRVTFESIDHDIHFLFCKERATVAETGRGTHLDGPCAGIAWHGIRTVEGRRRSHSARELLKDAARYDVPALPACHGALPVAQSAGMPLPGMHWQWTSGSAAARPRPSSQLQGTLSGHCLHSCSLSDPQLF